MKKKKPLTEGSTRGSIKGGSVQKGKPSTAVRPKGPPPAAKKK